LKKHHRKNALAAIMQRILNFTFLPGIFKPHKPVGYELS